MKTKQRELELYKGKRGGRRPGSGRKRIHSKGVSHRRREVVTYRTPMHINFKYNACIKNKFCLRLLKRAIVNARRQGLRIVHFSLQSNHIHLIIEAENNLLLTKGMRSLTVTFAKGLKAGKVQIERYHLHVLRSIRESRNAVHYVLFNKQKHEKGTYSVIDEYSSILNLEKALELVAQYARKKKLMLKIGKGESWNSDLPVSFLLKRALI